MDKELCIIRTFSGYAYCDKADCVTTLMAIEERTRYILYITISAEEFYHLEETKKEHKWEMLQILIKRHTPLS